MSFWDDEEIFWYEETSLVASIVARFRLIQMGISTEIHWVLTIESL